MTPVKPKRRYDSPRRAEQARQTRVEVLDAARRLFLHDGFAVTTIAAIAAEARVSVETIYKMFGGKPGLVRAIGSAHAYVTPPTTRRMCCTSSAMATLIRTKARGC